MQKIRKILRPDSEKKMLLKNRLTNNTEFIGPFHLGFQSTPINLILRQPLRLVHFSFESDCYFQFSLMHYECRWLVAGRGAAEYRLRHVF